MTGSSPGGHGEVVSTQRPQNLISGFWGVRYQVKDVERAIRFYTQTLGFNLDMQVLPAFGQVSMGGLKLILSGPDGSGSRPMKPVSQPIGEVRKRALAGCRLPASRHKAGRVALPVTAAFCSSEP